MRNTTVPQLGILPTRPSLSVCMIVRDEEKMLPRCLRSVQTVTDELIVVDTGSKDNTISIAKDFGAKVFRFKWCDDFSAARNESLKHATGDWILQMDADEELPQSSILPLRKAMLNPWCLLYVITCNDNYIENQSQRFVPVPRLFRNHPSISYSRPYHEMVSLSVQRIVIEEPIWQEQRVPDIVINHYGYATSDPTQRKKDATAIRIMESYVEENPQDVYILLMLGELYFRLGRYDDTIVTVERAKTLIANPPWNPYADLYSDLPSELPPWFCYILGSAYYRKGLYDEAVTECRRALDIDPFDTDAAECLVQAVSALGREGASKDAYTALRKELANTYKKMGEMAVENLIEALNDNDNGVRRRAAWALGEIRDVRAVVPLIEALRDEDWYITWGIRWAAVRALAKMGEMAVENLIEALNDNDNGVRWGAAWALGEIRDVRAVVPLIEALRDEDGCIRREAARALGQIGDKRAIEPLITALKDEYSGARREAAWGLGKIKNPVAVRPLIEALGDEDWDVRRQAAWGLGRIGNARVVKPLTRVLKDVNNDVQKVAREALHRINKNG